MIFRPFTMFDSVNTSMIPADARAVAGYVNGRWRTFPVLVREFPRARRLSIAVTADADAACLDVELGDATPDQAPAWVRQQHARGVKRPVLYTSVANARALLAILEGHGVSRRQVRLWTAHYTGRPHRCSAACGFGFTGTADATQYTNRALGRNLDASLCGWRFLPAPALRSRLRLPRPFGRI